MGKVYFCFGLHNHQPVGNFDHVFEWAHERCYLPLLSTLEKFPKIKFSLHTSGPLLDWMIEHDKEYMRLVRKMVKRGQIEIIGGGYYEPILPLISDNDKRAQLDLMGDFLEKEFGLRPKGMWLAERVWEPTLASVINAAKIDFTFLDDTHFRFAGLDDDEFLGYYTTEDQANPLHVFPISKALRYKIPFGTAQEGIDVLNKFVGGEDTLITFFDDGEKFGLWPNTYEWVYEKKWMETFLSYLSDSVTIETIHPSQAIKKFSSSGLAYLPTASYEEMGEWVLTPHGFAVYDRLKKYLKDQHKYEEFKNFVRGGFFRNFHRKYPRLNYMHKRMLDVSRTLHREADREKDKKAFTHLWKAQTNCGYWHGIFGGFYLGHIRAAVYENLIKAQNLFDKRYLNASPAIESRDIDLDGNDELIVKNDKQILCFSQTGGSLIEMSLRDPAINLLNTITRQEESYHKKILAHEAKQEGVKSIHDIVVQKDKDLDKYLVYDSYERLSLIDHLLDKSLDLTNFNRQDGVESLSHKCYAISAKKAGQKATARFELNDNALNFSKNITIGNEAGLEAEYLFKRNDALKVRDFGIEFNLFLASIDHVFALKNKENTALNAPQEFKNEKNFVIVDSHNKISLQFSCDGADIFTMPVYSVSSSESGFEKAYQQLCVLFILKNRPEKFKIALKVER